MKTRIILTCILALLFLSKAPAQILTNGGFESWVTGPSTHMDPAGWQTNNDISSQASVIQGMPGRTGNYSASLVSIPDGFGGYVGGGIYFTFSDTTYIRPVALSGWWKGNFTATPADGINISMYITDFSSGGPPPVNLNTPVSTMLSNWTYFSDTVIYSSPDPVTNVSIAITLATDSSITNGQIDDLSMSYLVGVDELIEAHFPSAVLRPRGFNHVLYVDLLAPASFQMNMYNIDGRKIYTQDFKLPGGHHEFSVPTENLPEGIYLCNITGNDMMHAIKFIK